MSAFATAPTFQPAAVSTSLTFAPRPAVAVPLRTLTVGTTVGVGVAVGVGVLVADPVGVLPVKLIAPLMRERPKTPAPTRITVASAAQPKAIQPRPRGRGARWAPTRSMSAGISSNRSRGNFSAIWGWFPRRSVVGREGPRPAGGLPRLAEPQQPLDEHRVVRERGRTVDQRSEKLIVPRGGEAELFADRLLLGAGVPPPLTFEGEDRGVTLAQTRAPGVSPGVLCSLGHARAAFPRTAAF